MRVDGKLTIESQSQVIAAAKQHEVEGYSGLWSSESKHDPFLPLMVAAEHTTTLEVGTSIAVAFARNPMTLASTAWDHQNYSNGRFVLGLGSQVKPHIERRFSMPWGQPASRMREMVSAIRAIWDTWQNGAPLDFEGDFYQHTLMTPFFSPGPLGTRPPKVVIAAVGEAMCGFTTERYIREVTLPAIRAGREKAGRSMDDFEVYGLPLTATGPDEAALAAAIKGVRDQIAFYGSTPTYRKVLELHGWGELGDDLHKMSRSDDPEKWSKMGDMIDDDVLNTFAVVGEPEQIAAALTARYGDLMDRLQFYAPYKHDASMWTPIVAAFRSDD